jgi:hypothetical protein
MERGSAMTSQILIDAVPRAGRPRAGAWARPAAPPVRLQPAAPPVRLQPAAPPVRLRAAAPPVPLRQRAATWRARHWRRLVLAWFVLSLAILAVEAEPPGYLPKAQVGNVPAVRMVLRVAGGVTAAGVPLVLIVLP